MNFKHISPRIIVLTALLTSTMYFGQLGVNTSEVASSVHLEASNPAKPSASDGILIPRISTLPETAQAIGQLVYLFNNINLEDGFYIWDGTQWNLIITNQDVISQDESIYSVMGDITTPNYTTSNMEIPFVLNTIIAKNKPGFSIKNNQITIGKSGTYLLSLTSSITTNSISDNYTKFKYLIYVNGENIFTGNSTITTDDITAANVMMNTTAKFNKNDVISIFIQKLNGDGSTNNEEGISYTQYGNNSLKLTFLQQ